MTDRTLNNRRWFWLGGCFLAAMASAVNVHFLLDAGVSVSHLTGDLARLAAGFFVGGQFSSPEIAWLATALLGFLAGATASGLVIQHPAFAIERPYGRAVCGIGLTLLLASRLQLSSPMACAFLSASGCGFQNGLATHYRGLVLRTTHITGILTDIGQLLGLRLAGHAVDTWKILIQTAIVLSFFLGAIGGTWVHLRLGTATLAAMGAVYVAGGLMWTIGKRWSSRRHSADSK
ncbi:MAG: DUF1275 domain-containing protein [Planctomycetes bacterium]|nr:DUF1275 domain-containing protein [Planctomycetota bacterium]